MQHSFTPKIQPINVRHLHSLLEASYLNNDEAKEIATDNGYLLDEELSNDNAKVFRDKHDSSLIAFRGTQTFDDVLTDALLFTGLTGLSSRFKESDELVERVRDKYKSPIITLGHSLGGRLAESTNENTGLVDKVITVNKGTGIFDSFKTIKDNQTDIHSNTDIVSVLANTQKGGKHINNPGTFVLDPLYSHKTNHLRKFNRTERF